ncbi:hypothetical protein BSW56_23960, partial [Salmonella enterica subsp. enterica serovar Enteritidis]
PPPPPPPLVPFPAESGPRYIARRTWQSLAEYRQASSLMIAREPHHGVMLNTGPLPFGKRGASYQMTRRCKAFLCLK